MHSGILSAGIVNGGHWSWPSRSFLPFWLRIQGILIFRAITFNGFELESPNLHQIWILGFLQLVLKMEGIDLDLQGHSAISTHKTAFNVALVHWSRPAKGCYMSQMCSCLSYVDTKFGTGNRNPSSLKPRICSSCIVRSIVIDDLVAQEVRILTLYVLNF